jgi:VWFA-related protein
VVDAAQYLAKSAPTGARRVIIVISDGEDNNSEKNQSRARSGDDAGTKAGSSNSRASRSAARIAAHRRYLYSLNPSGESLRLNVISTRAQQGMQQFATATGGAAFTPERETDLDAIFRQIAGELRSQYLLQYYSQNASPNGTFLSIKVRTPSRPYLRIRAKVITQRIVSVVLCNVR